MMSIQDHSKEATELSCELENKPDNHFLVADFVNKFRNGIIHLKESKVTNDMHIRICGLNDTVFSGEHYRLRSWGDVYCPKPTKLEILGILESPQGMAPIPEWIILVGKEGPVYCYRDEVLYLFANSLKEFLQDGVTNIDTRYNYPDDISDEGENILQDDEEIQRLRRTTAEFIDKDTNEFIEFFDMFIS